MPKRVLPLTAASVSKLAKQSVAGRFTVGGVVGLHLYITPWQSRIWVLRITTGNSRKDVSLGSYADLSLSQARELAQSIRSGLARGLPLEEAFFKKKARLVRVKNQQHTFTQCAELLIARKSSMWKGMKNEVDWTSSLETYAYPTIGVLDVDSITMEHVLQILQPIWESKTVTASRVRGRIEAVLDYAQVQGWRNQQNNPARWKGLLDKVLPSPKKIAGEEHHKALEPKQAKGLLLVFHDDTSTPCLALQLLVLTATRASEVCCAKWGEFDVDKAIWTIPASRMKAGKEHRIPLSKQAIKVFHKIPKLDDDWVFVNSRGNKPITSKALVTVLKRYSIDCVNHGFRSTFRDWAGDYTDYPREILEAALAHQAGNAVELAYRRRDALEKRRPLMQDWADYLYGNNDV